MINTSTGTPRLEFHLLEMEYSEMFTDTDDEFSKLPRALKAHPIGDREKLSANGDVEPEFQRLWNLLE